MANEGALDVADIDLTLRLGSVDGSVLAMLQVQETIVPGAYHDVSWVWEDAAPFLGGSVEVFATVDEADVIDEFDEDNNVRSAVLTSPRGPLPVMPVGPGPGQGGGKDRR